MLLARGSAGLEHVAAVVVDEPAQLPQVMAKILRLQRLGPLDAPVAPDQALDMGGRAVLAIMSRYSSFSGVATRVMARTLEKLIRPAKARYPGQARERVAGRGLSPGRRPGRCRIAS